MSRPSTQLKEYDQSIPVQNRPGKIGFFREFNFNVTSALTTYFRDPEYTYIILYTIVNSFLVIYRFGQVFICNCFLFCTSPQAVQLLLLSCFTLKPQYPHAYSPHCSSNISYFTSWENLIKHQHISCLVIIFFTLMTCMFDQLATLEV